MAAQSQVRQNFDASSEQALVKAIHSCLQLSYQYLSLETYFERDDVALPGFRKYFADLSNAHRENANQLVEYQHSRGGRVTLHDLAAPQGDGNWSSPLNAMQKALEFEKAVHAEFLQLHSVASDANDPNMTDFVEEKFLDQEVERLKKIGDHITGLKLAGPNLGEYLYDKESMESS